MLLISKYVSISYMQTVGSNVIFVSSACFLYFRISTTLYFFRFYLQFETVRSTDLFMDYIAIDDVSFSQGCTFVGQYFSLGKKVNNHLNALSLNMNYVHIAKEVT